MYIAKSLLGVVLFAILLYSQLVYAEQKAMNHAEHDMLNEEVPKFNATGDEPMSYALFPDDKGIFYSHVSFMAISFWVLMPMGVMLGIARSSLHVPIQILTFILAMFGFFFGKLYGHSSPHLYEGNIHHSFGWFLFALLIAQLVFGFVRKISDAIKKHVAHNSNDQYETIGLVDNQQRSSSVRSDSLMLDSTLHNKDSNFEEEQNEELLDLNDEDPLTSYTEKPLFQRVLNRILPYIPSIVKRAFEAAADNRFTNSFCRVFHFASGRLFIVFIFIQTISGMVVYHGVCRDWEIFGCIAHLIKGGIFFFYGIITFSRYLGAFAEKGWAWNYIENGSKFSFEMIECFLIFFYGITNTWMEHFGQDSAWTHKDLEHASLAFMFLWAGLLGMLIESRDIRRMIEKAMPELPYDEIPAGKYSTSFKKSRNSNNGSSSRTHYKKKQQEEPNSTVNFNPIPALTILMTGISMGNHHQDTLYSSRVHYLWGLLISAAAVCRMITYFTLFRAPPKNGVPTRPPSEASGAFLLVTGSILFMASNQGTILWLRRNQVDSMFLLNAAIALTGIALSYVAFLVILKAWAVNRETHKKMKRLNASNYQRASVIKQRRQFEIGHDDDEDIE